MISLYELTAQLQNALDRVEVDPDTGELVSAFPFDDFEAIGLAFDEKAEGVACYIKGLNAEAAAIKAEQDTLAARRKAAENKAERLREYLANCMTAAGKDKLKTARCSLSWRKTSAVGVYDIDALPENCRRIKVEPDKTAIKAALAAGEDIPGATILESRSLQIR